MSGGFLEQMARGSAERVAQAKSRLGEGELLARARALPPPLPLALDARGFDLIAEVKLRSPAAGRFAPPSPPVPPGGAAPPSRPVPPGGAAPPNREPAAAARDLAPAARELTERVEGYARAGAAAVSVLTEPERFDGALEHLQAAAQALDALRVPAMRKDFLVDPYQVLEARVAGAGGVLVILRMLSESQAAALLDCARDMGLFVLLEAFDEADIDRAHAIVETRLAPARARRNAAPEAARAAGAAGPLVSGAAPITLLVGLNCRDLDTLQVVPGRLESLAGRLPVRVPRVAESGVGSAADAARVAAAGYDLALVGSALMTGGDPATLVRDLLAAGRGAIRRATDRRPAAASTDPRADGRAADRREH